MFNSLTLGKIKFKGNFLVTSLEAKIQIMITSYVIKSKYCIKLTSFEAPNMFFHTVYKFSKVISVSSKNLKICPALYCFDTSAM